MKPFGLDALLGRWPALEPQNEGGASWDERADATVKAALALKEQGSAEIVTALLEPPPLEAEPGEERAASFQFLSDGASDRDERGLRPSPQIEETAAVRASRPAGGQQPMSSETPKRPSLKELAARASQASAGRSSITSLPPPSARASAPPPSTPATVTPIAKAKAARASDPGREDSGVLRLASLTAAEETRPAAEPEAPPASTRQPAAAAAAAAPVVAKPAAASPGGSKMGVFAAVGVAVLGLAAAFVVYQKQEPAVAPQHAQLQPEVKQQEPAPAATAEAPRPQETAAAVASSEPAPAVTAAPVADDAKGTAGGAPAPAATAVAVNGGDVKAAPQPSAKPVGQVGTLDEEMKKAVGADALPSAPQDDGSKPASGGSGGNVPEQPSQGNAQAAIRAVLPGAKACVAGAAEPTSASVTFSSSGAVQSVSVGGWAAANGKAGCVKSALQGARVAPFAKPTFTVPVTVRP